MQGHPEVITYFKELLRGELADQIVTLTNDGAGNFTNTIVSDTIDFAYYADAADMDGDGDYDILGSSFNLNQLIWWATTQTEDNTIAAGDAAPQSYYSGNVVIDFSASDQSENVSVFYNAGAVPDRASFDTGIDHLATRGFYTVTTPKTNYTASIDFAYGSANVTEWASITDENDLVILVFSKTNDRWEIAGTSQNISTGANVITVNGISSEFDRYSRWTIGSISTDNPLPVQLAGFGARSLPTGVSLSWNTASELNNLGFELYRASDQQTDFQLVASYTRDHELIGHGNSSQENSYRFLDSRVESGRQYEYKLVSVDMDGTRWENARTSVFFDGSQEILTFQLHQNYPNPFNGVTQIPFTLERTDARGKLEIFDVLGRKIRSFYFHGLDAGLHTIAWDAMDENGTAVGSGQYMYVLTVGEQRLSNRLIYVK